MGGVAGGFDEPPRVCMKRIGCETSQGGNGFAVLKVFIFSGFQIARSCWTEDKPETKPPGFLRAPHSCSECDAHSGLWNGFRGAVHPGLAGRAVTFCPYRAFRKGRTHSGYHGLPLQAGCKPDMLQPGLEAREEEHKKTVQTALQGQNRSTEFPTHHARQGQSPLSRSPTASCSTRRLPTPA